MALDDIIKKNRGGPGNRRGRGRGRGGNAASGGVQRGQRGGRIGKANNSRGRGGGGVRRGGGRNSYNQGNNNRSNNNRSQRGNGNSFSGVTRRKNAGDKPTATYNPLSRDENLAAAKQQQQQQQQPRNASRTATTATATTSVFNKIRRNAPVASANVGALRRRMLAAQQALSRATKTLAAMPRLKQQRQRFLQQPQQLKNIITRNRVAGGAVRKRLGTGRKTIGGRGMGRGGARRMFV